MAYEELLKEDGFNYITLTRNDPSLKNDSESLNIALDTFVDAYYFADDKARTIDNSFKAIVKNYKLFAIAPEELQDNKELIMKLLNENKDVFKLISFELKYKYGSDIESFIKNFNNNTILDNKFKHNGKIYNLLELKELYKKGYKDVLIASQVAYNFNYENKKLEILNGDKSIVLTSFPLKDFNEYEMLKINKILLKYNKDMGLFFIDLHKGPSRTKLCEDIFIINKDSKNKSFNELIIENEELKSENSHLKQEVFNSKSLLSVSDEIITIASDKLSELNPMGAIEKSNKFIQRISNGKIK